MQSGLIACEMPAPGPRTRAGIRVWGARCLLVAFAAFVVAGCATPVGIRKVPAAEAERLLTANVLSSGQPSTWSTQLLERLGLAARYRRQPAAVLAEVHRGLGGLDESRRLFTLSELAFDQGERTGNRAWFLASAAYAWAYLFPDDPRLAPDRFDPRLRLTMTLYNRAVARGLARDQGRDLDVSARSIPLPIGQLRVESPASSARFAGLRLQEFVSVATLDVRGLRNHYRRSGIGAPAIARCARDQDAAADRWMPDNPKVPITLLLRFRNLRQGLRSGRLDASLEALDPEAGEDVTVGGEAVPVESDGTAAIAYGLEGAPVWDTEIAGFRRGDFTLDGSAGGPGRRLFMMHPWIPGRVPVVFVHGTASSPARWAEMLNELQADPVLRGRFQYWFFQYNTGNPIPDSAAALRETLRQVVGELDPGGADPALREMVVIGHSQGGLLAKMTAVRSGDAFWRSLSDEPFEAADLRAETRAYVQRTAFVEPLPFVRRLVFVATPHAGTMLASSLPGRIARRFIQLPGGLTNIGLDLLRLHVRGALRSAIRQIPTSIDNMSPDDPFLRTLHGLPIARGVAAHSIIAVSGDGPVEEGSDGVVRWSSAHLPDVESEVVVHSGHSTQSEPATIEEVRRILYEHRSLLAADGTPTQAAACSALQRPL